MQKKQYSMIICPVCSSGNLIIWVRLYLGVITQDFCSFRFTPLQVITELKATEGLKWHLSLYLNV